MNVNESSGNNDKKRYDKNNSSYAGTISSNKSSIQQESLINEFNLSPNSVINNGSNSYNYSISNQNASQDINKLNDNLQKPRLEAVEIKEKLKLIFHTKSLPEANLVWQCACILLFYSYLIIKSILNLFYKFFEGH